MATVTRVRARPERGSAPVARRPLTAFVLAGGASLGAMQAGMLRALYEHGIAPDLLVGTSAGALNAAFVASRPQTVATADALARVWRGLRRDDIFPINPRTLIGGLANQRRYLVPDRRLPPRAAGVATRSSVRTLCSPGRVSRGPSRDPPRRPS